MNKPNIIWFMFDSLRNEFLNEFGNSNMERTFIDELISKGVSFTNCHSTAPFTIVSMASKMTGCYPSLNRLDGWLKKDPTKAINPLCISFPEILRYNGYKTFYMASNDSCTYINPQGFDYYYAQTGYDNYPLEDYIKEKGPKFIYIDFSDVHDACCLNQKNFYNKDYETALKKASIIIHRFYDKIKTHDDFIILTSDHGIRTLDDFRGNKYSDEYTTGRYLTEKTTHNSFNLIWPGVLLPNKFNNMCRGVDIMPTVLDILGFEYPHLDGISLKPIIEQKPFDDIKYSYSVTGWSLSHPKNIGCWCVRDNRYKLVITEHILGFKRVIKKELFDYISNDEEDIDLSVKMPDKMAELENKAKKMFFSERNILDYYKANNFNVNRYIAFREANIVPEVVSTAEKIIKNNWQKKTRKRFLVRYRMYRLRCILCWYFPFIVNIISKFKKNIHPKNDN